LDPIELFGAASRLTRLSESSGAVVERGSCGPAETIRKRDFFFLRELFSLDY
jgi:hypothetical protein